MHHWQSRVHQHLSEQLDVALVLAPQRATLLPFENLDRLLCSSKEHRWQRGGEDETSSIRAHRVHQSGSACDVATNTAKGLT